MVVGYWLIGQLKYQDEYTESQADILTSMFGIDESPDTIREFLDLFEEEKEEFARRLAGNYSSGRTNSLTSKKNNRRKTTKKVIIVDSDNESDSENNCSYPSGYNYDYY